MRASAVTLCAGTGAVLLLAVTLTLTRKNSRNDYSSDPSLSVETSVLQPGISNPSLVMPGIETQPDVREKPLQKRSPEPVTAKSGAVQPPFAGYEKPFETFSINAVTGGAFSYGTGSTVKIPANALLYEDGTPATGQVDIRYREFHDVSDVFLSGIPMKYRHNDEETFFETAGMIEMRAEQNGRNIVLDQNKPVTVNMASESDEADYNLYAMNDNTGEWTEQPQQFNISKKPVHKGVIQQHTYIKQPVLYSIHMIDSKHAKRLTGKSRRAVLSINRLWTGRKSRYNKLLDNILFEMDMPKTEFRTQLKEIFNMRLRINKDREFKPDYINIEDHEDQSVTITISGGGVTRSYRATPYFHNRKGHRIIKKRLMAFARINTRADGAWTTSVSPCTTIDGKDYASSWTASSIVMREFSVRNFGIWNCDRPAVLPSGANVIAELNTGGGEAPFDLKLVDLNRNAVFSYYQDKNRRFPNFRFNPNADNLIWCATPEGGIAYILPEDVKKLETSGQIKIHLTKASIDEFMPIMRAYADRVQRNRQAEDA